MKHNNTITRRYKYLNSGPGGTGGAFVHERHADAGDALPRQAGWWSHRKSDRFDMEHHLKCVVRVVMLLPLLLFAHFFWFSFSPRPFVSVFVFRLFCPFWFAAVVGGDAGCEWWWVVVVLGAGARAGAGGGWWVVGAGARASAGGVCW